MNQTKILLVDDYGNGLIPYYPQASTNETGLLKIDTASFTVDNDYTLSGISNSSILELLDCIFPIDSVYLISSSTIPSGTCPLKTLFNFGEWVAIPPLECPFSTNSSGTYDTTVVATVNPSRTSVTIAGNMNALGITDGTSHLGVFQRGEAFNSSTAWRHFDGYTLYAGKTIGPTSGSGGTHPKSNTVVGIDTDSSYSGIIGTADFRNCSASMKYSTYRTTGIAGHTYICG